MKKICPICKKIFDAYGSKTYCTLNCYKINKRRRNQFYYQTNPQRRIYLLEWAKKKRRKLRLLGKPLPSGISVENFSNLTVKNGRVIAAIELEKAMERYKCKI
ncbi:MAG: hypothetical protein NWE98_01985 [Candidatus Bathyarchaeota archaeon]|nr:hypothetical protein [Candidatus Bathyarchaeota archaeon]